MEKSISCINCGEQVKKSNDSDNQIPCPKCGSIGKSIKIIISDCVSLHDNIKGKVKDKNYPSKKNPRVEFFQGDDLRKSDGKWMKKDRLIDKTKNKYTETVTDPETNEIVHHCEEPLSDHWGHGTDKIKKDKT